MFVTDQSSLIQRLFNNSPRAQAPQVSRTMQYQAQTGGAVSEHNMHSLQSMQTLYEKRYDFMLQERGVESVVKTLGLLSSHTAYFGNADVALFILMKIHNEKIKVNIHAD